MAESSAAGGLPERRHEHRELADLARLHRHSLPPERHQCELHGARACVGPAVVASAMGAFRLSFAFRQRCVRCRNCLILHNVSVSAAHVRHAEPSWVCVVGQLRGKWRVQVL